MCDEETKFDNNKKKWEKAYKSWLRRSDDAKVQQLKIPGIRRSNENSEIQLSRMICRSLYGTMA